MRKKVALFDFDGTIAETVRAGVAVFNELAREQGFLEITPANIPMLQEKGAQQVARELGIPRLKIPMVVRRLRKGLKEQIPTVAPVEGMKPLLLALKNSGCELGIITSNSRGNVLAFLKNNKLEIFDYIRAGSGVFYKANGIRRIIKRHGLENRQTIYIGDEIRDVLAAKKNMMTIVAVTWGANSRKGLEDANADFVVDTMNELSVILSDFSEINL